MEIFFKATEKDLFKERKRNSLDYNFKLLKKYIKKKLSLEQNEQ